MKILISSDMSPAKFPFWWWVHSQLCLWVSARLGSPRKLGDVWVRSATLQVAWLSRVQAITQGTACAWLLQLKISGRTAQRVQAECVGARLAGESTHGQVSVAQYWTRLLLEIHLFIIIFFPFRWNPPWKGMDKRPVSFLYLDHFLPLPVAQEQGFAAAAFWGSCGLLKPHPLRMELGGKSCPCPHPFHPPHPPPQTVNKPWPGLVSVCISENLTSGFGRNLPIASLYVFNLHWLCGTFWLLLGRNPHEIVGCQSSPFPRRSKRELCHQGRAVGHRDKCLAGNWVEGFGADILSLPSALPLWPWACPAVPELGTLQQAQELQGGLALSPLPRQMAVIQAMFGSCLLGCVSQ